jgi:hypothetical protein
MKCHEASPHLSELALDAASTDVREHAAGCAKCNDELEALRQTVALVRRAGPGPLPVRAHAWPVLAAGVLLAGVAAFGAMRRSEPTRRPATPALETLDPRIVAPEARVLLQESPTSDLSAVEGGLTRDLLAAGTPRLGSSDSLESEISRLDAACVERAIARIPN